MNFFLLVVTGIYFFSFSILADYSYEDIAVLKKYGTIKTSENSEYAIISIIGHWSDNVGSFGKTECYGKLESEQKRVILFETFCKRESKDGYFIMKGIRTRSDIEAGVGHSNILGGYGVFDNLIGAKCTYAASYFKDSVQILTKCDTDKNKLVVK